MLGSASARNSWCPAGWFWKETSNGDSSGQAQAPRLASRWGRATWQEDTSCWERFPSRWAQSQPCHAPHTHSLLHSNPQSTRTRHIPQKPARGSKRAPAGHLGQEGGIFCFSLTCPGISCPSRQECGLVQSQLMRHRIAGCGGEAVASTGCGAAQESHSQSWQTQST